MATPCLNAEPSNAQFVADIRTMADFYEAHPDLPPPVANQSWDRNELRVFTHISPREFAEIAHALGVPLMINSSSFACLERSFGLVTVIYKQLAEKVCVSRQVATAPVLEWSLDGGVA